MATLLHWATRGRRLATACLLVVCAFFGTFAWGDAPPTVAVMLSETGRPHLEVLEALRSELGRGAGANIVLITEQEGIAKGTSLIVAVGVRATEFLVKAGTPAPVLATLVPRASFDAAFSQIPEKERHKFSAVFLDTPPRRQLALLRLAFPERRRIALLLGKASESQVGQFNAAAQDLGLSILTAPVRSDADIYPALQRLLPDADILLALPDPGVYNGRTIQDILLTAYRFRVPLAGFSPAYVKAGAILALYATPSRIGIQTADMARSVLAGRPLPPPQYAREGDVATNAYVARSLGINLDTEIVLRDRLRQSEHMP